MAKRLLPVLKYLFFIAMAVVFVWLSVKGLNEEKWLQLTDALSRAKYLLLIPILLLLLLSNWLRMLRWRMLIQPMGYNPSRINMFLTILIGYFVNYGAPRLGEIIKCTILAKYEKVPADKLIGTIVAERAVDLITLVIVFGITFIVQFNVISTMTSASILPVITNTDGSTSVVKILKIAGVLILFLLALRYIFSRFGYINIIQKTKDTIKGIWQGVMSIRHVKNKGMFIFHSVSIWVLYLLSTWLGFFALPETSHLGLSEAAAVLSMGSVGMIISPGGIGAYAYLVQQTVAFYNIPETPFGLALGWLLWVGQFITFVICGVVSFILLPVINKKKDEKSRGRSAEIIQVT